MKSSDVLGCLRELCSPIPTEHFEEVNQLLIDMKENNPGDLLKSFAEIINWEECTPDMRRKIISIMPLVIVRTNSGYFVKSSVPEEFTLFVFETLAPFFGCADEIGKSSRETMKEFLNACDNNELLMSLYGRLIETLTEESDDSYVNGIFDLLVTCEYGSVHNIQYTSYLIKFVQSRENTLEILEKAEKIINGLAPFFSMDSNENMQEIIEFFFYLVENNVRTCWGFAYTLLSADIIAAFPMIPQKLVELIDQENERVMILKNVMFMDTFNDEQALVIMTAIINCFSLEEDRDGDNQRLESIACSVLMERDCLYPICIEYIGQHIQENGTNEKFAAAIINNILMFSSHISPENKINQEEIVDFLLDDENPKIQKFGLKSKSYLLSSQKEELTEEVVARALQSFYSDDTQIQEGGGDLIRNIFALSNDEANLVIVHSLIETIVSASNEEEVVATERIYNLLKVNSRSLSDAIATEIIGSLMEYITSVYQENPEASQTGWGVGVVGTMLEFHTITNTELLQAVTEFCSALFSDGNESDGLFLVTAICSKTKGENPEVLEFCVQFLSEHIESPSDEKELISILKLTNILIDYMTPEQMNYILGNLVGFCQCKPKFFTKKMIEKTMGIIFDKCPDIFPQYIQEMVNLNISSTNQDFIIMMFNAAVEMENLKAANMLRFQYDSLIRFKRKRGTEIDPEEFNKYIDFIAMTVSKGMQKLSLYPEVFDDFLNRCPEEKKEMFCECFVKIEFDE